MYKYSSWALLAFVRNGVKASTLDIVREQDHLVTSPRPARWSLAGARVVLARCFASPARHRRTTFEDTFTSSAVGRYFHDNKS